MAEEQDLEQGKKSKKKLLIIIVAAVVILAGAGAAAFFLMGSDKPPEKAAMNQGKEGETTPPVKQGMALYVPIPSQTFNVPGRGQSRVAQIKVQLMVRGVDNEDEVKKHIPLVEGVLLKVFSSANADDLATEAGKVEIRTQALRDVRATLKKITGRPVVEEVLFTDFVMQ